MRRFVGASWRRYRSMSGRAQAIIAVLVVLIVIGAASGSSKKQTLTATSRPVATSRPPVTSPPSTTAAPSNVPITSPKTDTVPMTSLNTAGVAVAEASGTCHARGSGLYVLPDPACTPGATNPEVTQADISSTICRSGWTTTVRPPESYTEPLKLRQMGAYGEGGSASGYEEDHLISLELGGSPTSALNLWPEPGAAPNPKDSVENAAKAAVCSGAMTLAAAQSGIATDWMHLGQQLGVTGTGSTTTATAPPATAPPATSASAASSCTPTSSLGNCYKRGEYCPKADHGTSGTDANGATITCEDVNGTWRWE